MSGKFAFVVACFLGLSSCGFVYTSPEVSDGGVFGTAPDTDYDVDIVDLTYESAVAANLEPFVPQRLPAAFQPDAAASRLAAAGPRSPRLISIPRPTAPPESRPGFIPDRLPPRLEPRPYRLGVSDVLLLAVTAPTTLENLPALIDAAAKRQGYVVQDDGAIAIPDVGRVRIAGLTMPEAEDAIFQAVAAAGIDPSFTVEIAEFNSQRVAVGGLVASPSLVPISLKPLYLNDALQLAGGIVVPDPEVAFINIFRDGEAYQISLERYLRQPGLQNFLLLDSDNVFVGSDYREEQAIRRFEELIQLRGQQIETTQFQLELERLEQERLTQERMLHQSERDLFLSRVELGAVPRQYAYLTGEVRKPARFPLPFENQSNLADVLFDGGGIDTQFGDYEEIYVLRGALAPDQFGGVTAFHLDAENATNLVVATTFLMRPNDVVFVAEQPITAWNRTISQILPQLFINLARDVATGGT